MSLPDLYVGKIVHFVGISNQVHGRHLPAIVIRIVEGQPNWVGLTVFTDQVPSGTISTSVLKHSIGYSAEMVPETWHFIEDCHRLDADLPSSDTLGDILQQDRRRNSS